MSKLIIKDAVMPITAKGIKSLSNTDYGTLGNALAELIDNAWEEGYPTKKSHIKSITSSSSKAKNINKLLVFDDGPGMNFDTLEKCLTIGSEVEKTKTTLGTYGMGMKTSALWCGNHVQVFTKQENGSFLKAAFGIDGGREIYDISDDDDALGWFESLIKSTHGTVILISELNKNRIPKTVSNFTETVIKAHGIAFSKLIEDRDAIMYVNGSRVTPIKFVDKTISVKMSPDDAVWRYTDTYGNEKCIPYEAWYTPGGKEERDDVLSRKMQNQGFICVRNGRTTGYGMNYGIVVKNNIYNGCRIILYTDCTNDTDFGISYGKMQRGSIAETDTKEALVSEFKRYFELAKKYQTEGLKKGETTEEINKALNKTMGDINNNEYLIKSLQDLKCNGDGLRPVEGTPKSNDEGEKKPKGDEPKKHRKSSINRMKACGVDFRFEVEDMGEDGNYIQPDCTEDGVGIIRINSAHNYYINFMSVKPEYVLVDHFRGFVGEWLSVYGLECDKSVESIDDYNKRLTAKSKAMSSIYRERQTDGE